VRQAPIAIEAVCTTEIICGDLWFFLRGSVALRLCEDQQERTRRCTNAGEPDVLKGIHPAQLLSYMKLAGIKTGLLINFKATS
jgi:hypothetical protein